MTALDAVFKAYDVRGTVPDQLDDRSCRAIGWAFARFAASDRVVVARDMRPSGVALAGAFAAGARVAGASVIDLGLASTDMMYFASGRLEAPGAMFTASHNPAAYNGVKLCLSGARPVGQDTGLAQIRDQAEQAMSSGLDQGPEIGGYEQRQLLDEYASHVPLAVQHPFGLDVALQTHWPLALQLSPAPQVPQLPLHPSPPHCLPEQLGTQPETHSPLALQLSPAGQEPQVPPQPSLPHDFPVQLGEQLPV